MAIGAVVILNCWMLEDSEVIDAIESIDGVISGEHHSNDELI